MTTECTHCGVKLDSQAVFCHWCQAPVARIVDHDPTQKLKWLHFWMYGVLPLWVVLCLGWVFLESVAVIWASVVGSLAAVTAWGLHQKKRWGWNFNWIFIVLTGVGLALLTAYDGTDAWVNKLFLTVPIVGLLWFWPNVVYWRKRVILFL